MLTDASDNITTQYRRVLASQVRVSNRLDCSAYDRPQLFRKDSPLHCLILTQGSLLRDLCRDYPAMHSFLSLCRLAINDEAQQGGHAASTILAAYLHRQCLQLLTGDKEQTKARSGGDPLREALLQRLASVFCPVPLHCSPLNSLPLSMQLSVRKVHLPHYSTTRLPSSICSQH